MPSIYRSFQDQILSSLLCLVPCGTPGLERVNLDVTFSSPVCKGMNFPFKNGRELLKQPL